MLELLRLDKKTFEVHFLEAFIKRIHEDIFGKDMSWTESSYTEVSLKEFLKEKEKEGAKRFLLLKLSRRALLKSESSHLLAERFVDEEIIEEVISHLEHLSLFDDSYLLESKIRSGVRKNYGKERIRQGLWSKKVPEEVFEEAFKKVEKQEDLDPVSQALVVIKKTVKEPMDYKSKQRLVGKLLRRGFEMDDIHEAIERYTEKGDQA